ncbi:PhzF family phenazine biosynthesis protein [Planococcus halotolerans]|uniref:PhzF family phenazine biosynthesis protein n=1 Tax=Planococcus halotolerans TaxID=2233542 RepID=A0A365KTL3_9BACL|nr:PhzF family phenazine biosynthesis protein [Planococcus halotolerans]QHJ71613.1 PhzF family phenazine biosynthesis isomerase [Planococcus halotolerans]RAZ76529.1 PhzF family phenazine biosynthesis protein [Planococcus halotolerans]
MKNLQYTLVDVFTDTPFGGNQLAVVEGRNDLSTETMQKIARELNLSETVFVFPPQKSDNTRKLRIFTPQMELPMAGHPTIGAAYVLTSAGAVQTEEGRNECVFEEEVGEILVTVLKEDGRIVKVEMKQPLPVFNEKFENRKLAADLLSLTEAELHPDLPVQPVSSGVPFLFIPVKSLQAIRRIQFRLDVWEQHFKGTPNFQHIFAFTAETESAAASVHGRMFAPAMGISEDPATGGASGPLGAYLVKHKILPNAENGIYSITSEQGFEMERPSFIEITVHGTPDNITEVKIGGNSVTIGKGELFI